MQSALQLISVGASRQKSISTVRRAVKIAFSYRRSGHS
ncbi:hypothetical protein Ae263Ps1_5653c [Pseudonocardia sp. Ae263_Ps1]|nr:hypothetical protein Ae150APs1_5670 [Pseudonocardia sp. Ae150A_Ps1]OLL88598.1 hypothetical protein Ae263Ps1_5653c [Pseudonocardia sp. Ae263_Ps1]OLL91381.1 hypothetical protein Ae356Ps1_1278 [Pseudonocardia sp. Ae356_Ps1]